MLSIEGKRSFLNQGESEIKQSDNIVVMKFGGTSMGDAESIGKVAQIIKDYKDKSPLVVVVSAVKGITNQLSDLDYNEDQNECERILNSIEYRHYQIARGLNGGDRMDQEMGCLLSLLKKDLFGEQSVERRDRILSYGERLSAILLSEYLLRNRISAKTIESTRFIETDDNFGEATPDLKKTAENAQPLLFPLVNDGVIPVITGFIGRTVDSRITTFGRNTSDFSASFIGRVLGAGHVWIFTDVDGICTADPNIVPDAQVIPELTMEEAAEMANRGAKVVHPKTFTPLWGTGIVLKVMNTFNRRSEGTTIRESSTCYK